MLCLRDMFPFYRGAGRVEGGEGEGFVGAVVLFFGVVDVVVVVAVTTVVG